MSALTVASQIVALVLAMMVASSIVASVDPGEAALVLGVALVSAAGIGWLVGGGIDG